MKYARALLFTATLIFAFIPVFSRSLWAELWAAFYWPALFVVQLFLLTWPWRTVSFRLVLWAFLLGAGPVMALTLLIQAPIVALTEYAYQVHYFFADIVGKNVDVGAVFLAPVSEELLKILPVLLILIIGRWRHLRYTAGPLDFAVLGAAVGAGFQFMETVWQGILYVDLHSYARIAEHVSPHLGPFYLLPTLEWQDGAASAWFGHAGVTATLALAVGLALRLGVRNRAWWLLPIAVGGLVTFEHFLTNLGEPPVFWVKALAVIDLYGVLSSVLFTAGVIWAVVMASRVIKRYREADPEAVFGFGEAGKAIAAGKAALPETFWLALLLMRLHRATAFGMDWYGRSRRRPEKIAFSLYGMRETTLALKASLLEKGVSETA
jgi:RsiW-degrading membrane proteinase PrsW (M82 family)